MCVVCVDWVGSCGVVRQMDGWMDDDACMMIHGAEEEKQEDMMMISYPRPRGVGGIDMIALDTGVWINPSSQSQTQGPSSPAETTT